MPTHYGGSHKPLSIENIAQTILEKLASEEAHPDSSLGSYVVSLLLESNANAEETASISINKDDSPSFDKVDQDLKDSLLELVQEHCLLDEPAALEALEEVHQAIHEIAQQRNISTSIAQASMVDALSPKQAKSLIPNDLLGEDDDDMEHYVEEALTPTGFVGETRNSPRMHASASSLGEYEFPPLGTASTISKTKLRKMSHGGQASLYDSVGGVRSRESSLDETTTSNSTTSTLLQQPLHATTAVYDSHHYSSNEQREQVQEPQQFVDEETLNSCVEYLVAMNTHLPLARAAAVDAALTADANPAMAQYLIDLALASPQVCRHYLDKGCYRADCAFSHVVGVCLFWIKGSCRWKAGSCPFYHHFDKQIVYDVLANMQEKAAEIEYFDHETDDDGRHFNSCEGIHDDIASHDYACSDSQAQKQSTFAAIASQGFSQASFAAPANLDQMQAKRLQPATIPTVPIPQNLWNPHENRDSSVFFINDPMERYLQILKSVRRNDVIDLHFQSTKTFSAVLSNVLPAKLETMSSVWIVTGTGHHVGSQTDQKGGGALEAAVLDWLQVEGYNVYKGRDRNGQGGAILIRR
ncbi:hypothetical protein MPSEU_000929300 [Mayamaea pseudoterrestris]|nr:hypothetical protein MPSEU_000929300 [Mayamaea pseudoterrestris]